MPSYTALATGVVLKWQIVVISVIICTSVSECYQNDSVTSFIRYVQSPETETSGHPNHASQFSFFRDPIFTEFTNRSAKATDGSEHFMTVAEYQRGKRGAIELGQMMRCSTGCDPLSYKGYGCYCGFLGSGRAVDGIDKCCKMHDMCYTTTTCMDLQYHLPYFVPFKWKCNGGAPYCIPGNRRNNGRDSCSHQLCECDRQFAQCLRNFPCPKGQATCPDDGGRFLQNMLMSVGSGHAPQYNTVERSRGRARRPRVLSIFGIKIGK
ncbi:hypothetical protein TCAL_15090 [Tigriopus californicus]|uniref:Phospholipase A2 n=1 Tax=Tigriopus californicus TaxID=6832 RepID=A0A553NVU5_TIGCA|nr:otoconin-90-like [Tigriopus californicus]TRY69551.1 hypothetical protein TCAL_15090 [Tigriopus californicus]